MTLMTLDIFDDVSCSQKIVLLVVTFTLVWHFLFHLLSRACTAFAERYFSRPIPPEKTWIPSVLPHPNPPGAAVRFDVRLADASEDQVARFLRFVGRERAATVDPRDVARSSARYKGQLYESKVLEWIDRHFRLRQPRLCYPYVAPHFNGFASFWLETGPHIRKMFVASMVLSLEHAVNGAALPLLYLSTREVAWFNLTLVSECGVQVVLIYHIALSYWRGIDITVEQMHRAVWPALLVHHVCTLAFCILCLHLGDACPREDVARLFLALLGFTSTLHYVSQMLDFSPLSQANTPWIRMANHAFCLGTQLYYRGWSFAITAHAIMGKLSEVGGAPLQLGCGVIALLFGAFNIDFIKFHYKATVGCAKRICCDCKLGLSQGK